MESLEAKGKEGETPQHDGMMYDEMIGPSRRT